MCSSEFCFPYLLYIWTSHIHGTGGTPATEIKSLGGTWSLLQWRLDSSGMRYISIQQKTIFSDKRDFSPSNLILLPFPISLHHSKNTNIIHLICLLYPIWNKQSVQKTRGTVFKDCVTLGSYVVAAAVRSWAALKQLWLACFDGLALVHRFLFLFAIVCQPWNSVLCAVTSTTSVLQPKWFAGSSSSPQSSALSEKTILIIIWETCNFIFQHT